MQSTQPKIEPDEDEPNTPFANIRATILERRKKALVEEVKEIMSLPLQTKTKRIASLVEDPAIKEIDNYLDLIKPLFYVNL